MGGGVGGVEGDGPAGLGLGLLGEGGGGGSGGGGAGPGEEVGPADEVVVGLDVGAVAEAELGEELLGGVVHEEEGEGHHEDQQDLHNHVAEG